MWYISKVGYKSYGSKKSKGSEKLWLHVAKDVKEAEVQLRTLVDDDTFKTRVIKPCPIPATVNGQPCKLFAVSCTITEPPKKYGDKPKEKHTKKILAAIDSQAAAKRIHRYVESSEPLKNINVDEITETVAVTQKEIKDAFFAE